MRHACEIYALAYPDTSRQYLFHMNIRPATSTDWPHIWAIIEPVIRAGETYALDPTMNEEAARSYWIASDKDVFVAQESAPDAAILGTYYIHANQAGGGAHVSNCGYMTSEAARGKGVARTMCLHSLEHAKAHGFKAMQFNFVVSSNEGAVYLWQKLGFDIVGRLPGAFLHPKLGYVDALVMYRYV